MKKIDYREITRYCTMTLPEIEQLLDWSVHIDGLLLGGRFARSGPAKILAIAHVDFIGSGVVHKANRREIVCSALDDRLGVYLALNMEGITGIPLDVILTDGEESGQSTARYISDAHLEKYNWIVEFDRMNLEPVTYGFDCMVPHLESLFARVGFGSYTDIVELENKSPVGAYNHGIGYQRQHSENCSVKVADVRQSIANFVTVYERLGDTKIEHDPYIFIDDDDDLDTEYEQRLQGWSDPYDIPDDEPGYWSKYNY